MQTITTLTPNPAVDLYAEVDRVVADEKLRCRDPRRDAGGGGINVARVVGRLGEEVRAVYPVGGPTGRRLRELLAQEVDSVPVEVGGDTREDLTVGEAGSGRQFRFIMPGPELAREEGERLRDAALDPAPDYLVASGSLPPGLPTDFYAELARRAREAGSRVVLDTAGEALEAALEAGVFLLKPNLRELGHIAGRDISRDPDQEEVASELVSRGAARVVVVSLGAAGVLVVGPGVTERVPAPTVPIRSRIGAGDSSVAGITLALARGEDLMTAVRLGVAAGAAAVMTPGTELCRRSDTERLFRQLRGRADDGVPDR